MGFSLKKMFSGSGWRKFKGTVGGVLSIATSVIPGVGGVAGKLLASKGTLGGIARTANKGFLVSKAIRRGKTVASMGPFVAGLTASTAAVLKASPVMPGGGIAGPGGVAPAPAGAPPRTFGGSGGTRRRKKRRAGALRTAMRTRRKARRRLPKFGSPAWRKKFKLDGQKRRRRR